MTTTLMSAERSLLLLIDYQSRLMPAIASADAVVANAGRLAAAARLLDVPGLVTEQSPAGLGATVTGLDTSHFRLVHKETFGACATPGFIDAIGDRPDLVVAGCEAHVCVTQTCLGLLELGRRVFLVRDATGARTPESKEAAIARLARQGAEIVTTEMVVFEWLRSSANPRFKDALAIVK